MKNFVIFCVSVTLGFILFSLGWSTYYAIKGDEILSYDRFHTENDVSSKFNQWGLISPFQIERQSIVNDTIHFKHKIVYPRAKNCLEQGYENFISDEIYKFISDTITKVEIKNQMDYDRTSYGVREYKNPKIRKVEKPYVSDLSLVGTASPEWAGYGFKQSIQPGHIEKENMQLAGERLSRILKNLEKKGFTVKHKRITEIQLSKESVQSALKDKNALIEMRYVEAKGDIIVQKVKVTTIVFPVLPMLWLLLFLFLYLGLRELFSSIEFRNFVFSFGTIIIPLLSIAGIMIALVLLVVAIANGLFIPIIFLLVVICLILFRNKIVKYKVLFIGSIIYYIISMSKWCLRKRRILKFWWRMKSFSEKVLYFLIPYSIGVSIFALYVFDKYKDLLVGLNKLV